MKCKLTIQNNKPLDKMTLLAINDHLKRFYIMLKLYSKRNKTQAPCPRTTAPSNFNPGSSPDHT